MVCLFYFFGVFCWSVSLAFDRALGVVFVVVVGLNRASCEARHMFVSHLPTHEAVQMLVQPGGKKRDTLVPSSMLFFFFVLFCFNSAQRYRWGKNYSLPKA